MTQVTDRSVRSRMAGATARLRRLQRIDRAAVFVISLGGFAVVISVLGILVFIALEAIPLFRPAGLVSRAPLSFDAAPPLGNGMRAVGVDEYRQYLSAVLPDARVAFYPLPVAGAHSGAPRLQEAFSFPVPGLEPGTPIVSSSRSLLGQHLAAATADGRVALMQVRYTPRYEGQSLDGVDVSVVERGVVVLDPAGRAVREVSYDDRDGARHVAGLLDDGTIAIWQGDESGDEKRAEVGVAAGQRVTHVRVGTAGVTVASTDAGRLYRWEFSEDQPWLTDVSRLEGAVTALDFVLGGNSVAAGTDRGEVAILFRAPRPDGSEAMVLARSYAPRGGAVLGFAMSPRDRSFATSHADGSVVLRHATSGRTLAVEEGVGRAQAMVVSPKADAVYVAVGGTVVPLALDNPHPEVSWRTLFSKVWYEGYPAPEYVWQSTGATDDFESKLSLVPLVFGTMKGTLYAMLFAVPLGVLGALYTSQFVHPSIKAKIKPAVEIMAALPSVVIGFLAGLYLAGVVERNLVGVFLMMALMPLFGTSGVLVWRVLPHRVARRLRPGSEIAVILPLLLLAGWLSLALGPRVEGWLFGGDAKMWIETTLGLTYDQRNSLVVGLAMGLAVIPIVFTISEDAFTSVPSSLTAASLALGASRWQTATRVVLPTASPGVFSAIMVGFGRAVGETMIVLMATGNTPLMDWSIFNGFRTLSANIAVEIPEAPAGGTLYRTLFLAAVLLFLMTFVLNTVAEIIRQRLRDRYKAV
ncbi:MAG: ABC transporter permease subunit [Acidobacteria bacterium]|nr:ABC transporter permease subunit [Acidobacteriota bacterium]